MGVAAVAVRGARAGGAYLPALPIRIAWSACDIVLL